MAQRIGKEVPQIVVNVELYLDVPRLLSVIATSEEHIKHVQAIQVLSGQLDAISKKAVEINDPGLTDILMKMKLLRIETGEGFILRTFETEECNCENGILEETCGSCHGSGEGGYDGSICSICKGRGIEWSYCTCIKGNERLEEEIF